MKTLSIIILSLFFTSFTDSPKHSLVNEKYETTEATVLICTGKYSKRYHNSICRGMKACKGERQKVSLSDAKKMGLTKCGYCYN